MGFKIIRDFIEKEKESNAVGIESVRQTGFNAMFMTEEEQGKGAYNGGKIKVRLKDDDGNIYYHAHVDDDDFSCELAMNWGTSYSGVTSVDIHIDDYRKLYGEPKHEKHISECGKWYAHM